MQTTNEGEDEKTTRSDISSQQLKLLYTYL